MRPMKRVITEQRCLYERHRVTGQKHLPADTRSITGKLASSYIWQLATQFYYYYYNFYLILLLFIIILAKYYHYDSIMQ